jgi:hypothetical protein
MLSLSTPDFLWFVDQALGEMSRIVDGLGDELANRRPDVPGDNSPYAIVTHCLGVMEFWGGSMIAGRSIDRDRPAEFVATGPVAGLHDRVTEARRQLERDLSDLDALAPPRGVIEDEDDPVSQTQGSVALHMYEELVQHLGQMELSRDVIVAGS